MKASTQTWAIVAAMSREVRPTLRALRATRSGDVWTAGSLVFTVAGMGATRASAAAERMVSRAEVLVSTGFAGAIDDTLEAGDLVIEGDPDAVRVARKADPRARVGGVVTVDRVLLTETEKRAVGPGALVVEMEAAAVAKVARAHGIGFLSVKAVVDTVAAPLASRYEGVMAVMGELLRKPSLLSRMMADGKRSRTAAASLARFYFALRV